MIIRPTQIVFGLCSKITSLIPNNQTPHDTSPAPVAPPIFSATATINKLWSTPWSLPKPGPRTIASLGLMVSSNSYAADATVIPQIALGSLMAGALISGLAVHWSSDKNPLETIKNCASDSYYKIRNQYRKRWVRQILSHGTPAEQKTMIQNLVQKNDENSWTFIQAIAQTALSDEIRSHARTTLLEASSDSMNQRQGFIQGLVVESIVRDRDKILEAELLGSDDWELHLDLLLSLKNKTREPKVADQIRTRLIDLVEKTEDSKKQNTIMGDLATEVQNTIMYDLITEVYDTLDPKKRMSAFEKIAHIKHREIPHAIMQFLVFEDEYVNLQTVTIAKKYPTPLIIDYLVETAFQGHFPELQAQAANAVLGFPLTEIDYDFQKPRSPQKDPTPYQVDDLLTIVHNNENPTPVRLLAKHILTEMGITVFYRG